jgi:hypothetical protein
MQYINVREYRRGNQKWTIQRNWQHRAYNTKKNKAKHGKVKSNLVRMTRFLNNWQRIGHSQKDGKAK